MHESNILIAAEKKYGKVIQMGNQQRSDLATKNIIKDDKQINKFLNRTKPKTKTNIITDLQ